MEQTICLLMGDTLEILTALYIVQVQWKDQDQQ